VGTSLAADNHTCQDVDECTHDNAGCSHTCLNTLGRAFCLCPPGFMLGADWKTCHGKSSVKHTGETQVKFNVIIGDHMGHWRD
jgi:hypothetical protein